MAFVDIAVAERALPLLFASLWCFVFGAFWYSPLVFGTMWLKLRRLTKKEIEAQGSNVRAKMMFGSIQCVLVAYVFKEILDFCKITDLQLGLQLTCMLWTGIILGVDLNRLIWERKPIMLVFIDSTFYGVQAIVITYIYLGADWKSILGLLI